MPFDGDVSLRPIRMRRSRACRRRHRYRMRNKFCFYHFVYDMDFNCFADPSIECLVCQMSNETIVPSQTNKWKRKANIEKCGEITIHMKTKIEINIENLLRRSRKSNGKRITDIVQSQSIWFLCTLSSSVAIPSLTLSRSQSQWRTLIYNNNGIDSIAQRTRTALLLLSDRLSIEHVIP